MRGSWWSGHFYYVGDDKADKCGEGRPGEPRLDPNGECQRSGAYDLHLEWAPRPGLASGLLGSYSLVWALHVEGTRLHTGGQFKRVSGVTQNSYASRRLHCRRGSSARRKLGVGRLLASA